MPNVSINEYEVPYKTENLYLFMKKVGMKMKILTPGGTDNLGDDERMIIQTTIQDALSKYRSFIPPRSKIITEWENKYPFTPGNTNILLLKFSRAKAFEDYKYEQLNEELPNTYNFDYNILYLNEIQLTYLNSFRDAFKVSWRDFWRGRYTCPTFHLKNVQNAQELWIRAGFAPNLITQIKLYGVFDELPKNDPNVLPSNFSYSDDLFWGVDPSTIDGLEIIVAYEGLISLGGTPSDVLTDQYMNVTGRMNMATGDTGFRMV